MGKDQPTPPPPRQNAALAVPPPPPSNLKIPKLEKPTSGDADIQKVLDQVWERQQKNQDQIDHLTPGGMAFGMMRNVDRKDWNTPLTELGHWPRGSSVAEIRKNPELMHLTPAKAMLKLFEMDDAMKAKKGN